MPGAVAGATTTAARDASSRRAAAAVSAVASSAAHALPVASTEAAAAAAVATRAAAAVTAPKSSSPLTTSTLACLHDWVNIFGANNSEDEPYVCLYIGPGPVLGLVLPCSGRKLCDRLSRTCAVVPFLYIGCTGFNGHCPLHGTHD